METIITTENLSKYYGKTKAVDNLSINVRKGEIYGFLGLNGAGKTTTIRMILGMIRPSSGNVYLKGRRVNSGNTDMWSDIGYLVEIPYSYPDLTVRENLDIIRRLRFINDPKSIDRIIELLRLGDYSDVIAKNLSLGNAQRLGLAKALIHNPDILLLDEPANGLDPAGIVEIRELLKDLSLNRGVTIFISSHILGEISKLVTRTGIIHEGRLHYESSLEEMENLRKICLKVKATDIYGAKKVLEKSGLAPELTNDNILEIYNREAISKPDMIARLLVDSGFPPSMLYVEEEDLEAFFLRIIKKKGGAE